jgi:hypothetical protein
VVGVGGDVRQLREPENLRTVLAESDKLSKDGSSSRKEKLLLVFEDLENEAKARRKMLDCGWGTDAWDANRWITGAPRPPRCIRRV